MSRAPKVVCSPTEFAVHRENEDALLGESAVTVKLCDEGGGRFVQITQGSGTVVLDPDELAKVARIGKWLCSPSKKQFIF